MNHRHTAADIECCVDSRCVLGESPTWSATQRVLYWLDVAPPSRLFAWHRPTRAIRSWLLSEVATGLATFQEDSLIVVSKKGLDVFSPERARFKRLANAPIPMADLRFNDCGCDPIGRLWTGTMRDNFDARAVDCSTSASNPSAGILCCFDSDLSCSVWAQGFVCPNTFSWSPDGRTMYVADSAANRLYAWTYDVTTGVPADRRVFASPEALGIPDGSAIDADGGLWNARWGAGCVVRFAADGTMTHRISLPADLVTSCVFGGDTLETLFITTARIGLADPVLAEQVHAGSVFAFVPQVPGAPRTRFCVRESSTDLSRRSSLD